jgi:hypothetical protein
MRGRSWIDNCDGSADRLGRRHSVKGVITIVARGPSAHAAGADSASAHAQAACAASAARSAPLLTHAMAEAGQSAPIPS